MVEARAQCGSLIRLGGPLLLAAGVLAISFAESAPDGPRAGAASDGAGVDAEAIYRRDCAECHGAAGEGTRHAPPLLDAGAGYVDYVLSTGRMPLDDPDDAVERGAPHYDGATIVAIAAYVDGFAPGGEPIPDVDLSGADVANGGQLYRLNCAACHHTTGAGGALVARAAPAIDDVEPRQVVEAIRVGPFEMPAFGPAAMTDAEVIDVAAYVDEVIDDPPDRGGLPIWRLGPVPEGAVAIVFGLGALVLIGVWIEGRARP
ncbi:MAG: c-type cytochrome [Acidimicrobiales bacterium]